MRRHCSDRLDGSSGLKWPISLLANLMSIQPKLGREVKSGLVLIIFLFSVFIDVKSETDANVTDFEMSSTRFFSSLFIIVFFLNKNGVYIFILTHASLFPSSCLHIAPFIARFASPHVSSNFFLCAANTITWCKAKTHQQCALSLIDVWRRRRTRINKNDERKKKNRRRQLLRLVCVQCCYCAQTQ